MAILQNPNGTYTNPMSTGDLTYMGAPGAGTPGAGGKFNPVSTIGQVLGQVLPTTVQATGNTLSPADQQNLQQLQTDVTNLGNTASSGKSAGGQPPAGLNQYPINDQNPQPGVGTPGAGGKSGGSIMRPYVDAMFPIAAQATGIPADQLKQQVYQQASQMSQMTPDQVNSMVADVANSVGVQQGGTPGRPVPAAPMVPRGPAMTNPGASGVQQNRGGYFQRNPTLAAPRPVTNLSPQPIQRNPIVGTMNKPNRGIGTIRGAGRGGILR